MKTKIIPLAALAVAMTLGIRAPTDLAARMGGEEFALLLPDTSLSEANNVCERLQALFDQQHFSSPKGHFGVSMSLGVVQCLGVGAERVLRAADANLYQAKAAGRHRMVCSVLEGEQPRQEDS